MSGYFENGTYPWIDPAYMEPLPVQPWTENKPQVYNQIHLPRHWQLWVLLVHYGDQLQNIAPFGEKGKKDAVS
jgi:hypothetical protein